MNMLGKVSEQDWSVSVEVTAVAGGFASSIHVNHADPKGKFEHGFKHHKIFTNEHEAMLEGLREGMSWIEQKIDHVFSV